MDDPWFTMIRGPGHIRITPRNARGWVSFAALMLVLLAPLAWVIPYARVSTWAVVAHVVIGAVVLIAFFRFAMARAEVIDIGALLRDAQRRHDEQSTGREK